MLFLTWKQKGDTPSKNLYSQELLNNKGQYGLDEKIHILHMTINLNMLFHCLVSTLLCLRMYMT